MKLKYLKASLLAVTLTFLAFGAFAEFAPRQHKEEVKKSSEVKEAVKPVAVSKVKESPKEAAKVEEAPAKEAVHSEGSVPVYPVEVLRALLEGNKRYANSKMLRPNQGAARRAELGQSQHPIAVIVSCSDSRVPPEIVFDQGVGDVFVIRTAGEVVDDVAMGSIEYAVEHLHVKLVIVLGHERCGAVTAAVAGGEVPGHIAKIVEEIAPAVLSAQGKDGDNLANCVISNVKLVSEKIRTSEPIISSHLKDGLVRVVGGYYDLDTGLVDIVYSPDISL